MNIAENTADTAQQAAHVVQADVQNQVTQSVTTLDQFKEFLLNHGPDVIYAIVIFIVGRYVATQEDGAGAARAMTNAMSDAGVTPADVKYINAHGTGTHHNDLFETRAIKLAFGDEAANLKINSTKSMIGHLLGAAGAVEFITCVKEIQDGFVHKTVGYETPDEEIDLNYCKDSYEEPVEYALSNSLGFGGHNASILLKAYK